MSRKMFVTSEAAVDERVAAIADADPIAALLWLWLIPHLDDWGRSRADSRHLKAKIAPMFDTITAETIEAAIESFAEQRLITLYESDGRRYLAVDSDEWWRLQTHIRREKRERDGSACPPPPVDSIAENRGKSRDRAENRARYASPHLTTPHHTSPHLTTSDEMSDRFERFWGLYPRKAGKVKAREAFTEATTKTGAGEILKGLERQLPSLAAREQKFIPLAANWLGRECWTDVIEPSADDELDRMCRMTDELYGAKHG